MGICCSCPSQGSVHMIEQWGRFDRIAYPGFNCVNCLIGECDAGSVSLRVQQLDVRCETKSKDNVFVTVVISVQYQVATDDDVPEHPHPNDDSNTPNNNATYHLLRPTNNTHIFNSFYKLTNTRSQISSYVFDVVRATVPKLLLDDVFAEKDQIAHDVRRELSKAMATYGFVITQALVTDIEPDTKVKAAMNEINAASRLRSAALDKAEAQKIAVVKAAEADAEAKYLAGLGIARQRQAIMNGLEESMKHFKDNIEGMGPQDIMQIMMMTQYFDTMKDIGAHSKSSTLFIPHGPGGMNEFSSQMRDAFLQASAAQQMDR